MKVENKSVACVKARMGHTCAETQEVIAFGEEHFYIKCRWMDRVMEVRLKREPYQKMIELEEAGYDAFPGNILFMHKLLINAEYGLESEVNRTKLPKAWWHEWKDRIYMSSDSEYVKQAKYVLVGILYLLSAPIDSMQTKFRK